MQFKHPELLYALFLLLIPIIIHLFQLRRFQKIDFTNVAFLKKVTIQTRKSSQLKKWLTLLTRLLALACIIVAFAQPFTASKTAVNTQKETVLYVDNSFSMQAKGAQGPLLQRALQELYTLANGTATLSWFTNDSSRKNVAISDFKAEILNVDYTQKQYTTAEVLLKANQLFSKENGIEKRLILVSDFQLKGSFPEVSETTKTEVVQLEPIVANNISVDTAYIASKNANTTQLKVTISAQGEVQESIPVSLYNKNTLIAKTAVDFSEKRHNTITFDIENPEEFKGQIELNEPNLTFDNTLYFSLNTPSKIKVLSINEANSNFLQRIFNTVEFEYTQQTFKNLNYNDIPSQHFVVLNELEDIPASLSTALKSFSDAGGSIFIIPSKKADIANYNSLLAGLQLGSFSEHIEKEKKISKIAFSHPLYQQVFEKQVVNFQYPTINSFFNISTNASSALQFEDGKPFVIQKNNSYLSTAPINLNASNFQNSPLIVPTIYNMAQLSLPLPALYYSIGAQNTFAVPVKNVQDEILKLKDSIQSFIPLQQTKANHVLIITQDDPAKAGIYQITKDETFIELVSYNYSRQESLLQYADANDWKDVRVYDSVSELFDTISKENIINSFWKWFVIFAVLFLVLEMLILKFYR